MSQKSFDALNSKQQKALMKAGKVAEKYMTAQVENLDKKFEVIFMDPPYKDKNLNLLLDIIKNERILQENGILIVHRHKDENDLIPNKLNIVEVKKYGLSKIIFLSIVN